MVLHTYLIFSGFFGYIAVKHLCMRMCADIKGIHFSQSDLSRFIDLIALLNLFSIISYWVLDSPTY